MGVGFLTGFVDSIAGGGGLISLPFLTLFLNPGAEAIGTNKVVGATAALVAFFVYLRSGQFDLRRSLVYALWIGVGSLGGSLITPLLPKESFRWILAFTCPLIFWVVLKKQVWLQQDRTVSGSSETTGLNPFKLIASGLVCGFYDGAWGPGAGTFMLLSLIFFARLPLLSALAASKLANSSSALVALASYAWRGYVHWPEGLTMALGIAAGAALGARMATQNAAQMVRPILLVVASLLVVKLIL